MIVSSGGWGVHGVIRFMGRLVRGIAYGTVILAVIVGAPWLLLHFLGSPVPTSVPNAETVREWFDQPNTGPHLFAVVLLMVWARVGGVHLRHRGRGVRGDPPGPGPPHPAGHPTAQRRRRPRRRHRDRYLQCGRAGRPATGAG